MKKPQDATPFHIKSEEENENYYYRLFNSIDIGFCIIDVLFDNQNKPEDYLFLEYNPAFEKHTGLKNVIGKTIKSIAPLHEQHWFEIYGKVAKTGIPVHFNNHARQLGKYYDVYAYKFGRAEDNHVAILFNDITLQWNAEQELNKSEVRFIRTLDSLQEGCAIINRDWKYLYVNDVHADHAKTPKDKIIGRTIFEVIAGVEQSKFFTAYKKCMEERLYQHLEDSFTFENGKVEWFEIFSHPVPEGIFILSMNVSKRKAEELKMQQALQEKEVLLRELYHRTKNNMQIISSLLSLRAAGMPDNYQVIFEEMKQRIQAMALVHERLYKTKTLSKLQLDSYINELVELLLSSYSSRINVTYKLSEIDVPINTAITSGLIITELITNVVKYAFPGGEPGSLEIVLKEKENNLIYLSVKDNGVGMTDKDFEDQNKLGIKIVKLLVEDQLNGSLILDNSYGTCWSISFLK
jgi:two-component system, sensor histidine kinase PdtaS